MFKKEPRIKALSKLKNSDRKKLVQSLKAQLKSDEDISVAGDSIMQTNFISTTAAGTIYTDSNSIPIMFKTKHSDTLYPTSFLLWSNNGLLSTVRTHSVVVENYIFNGADLMIAGTVPPFDSTLTIGTICAVATKEAPDVAIAVGIVKLNLPEYQQVLGKTGVAVEILHHFEDALFSTFKAKLEIPASVKSILQEETTADVAKESDAEQESQSVTEPPSGSEGPDDIAEVLDELTVEDVDYFIRRALYFTMVQDNTLTLPVVASAFMSNHIMRNLPDVDHKKVNIKRTSWKKTAKFLKYFEKEGFLKLKGKGDDLIIVGMNKDKDELKNFVPYKIGNTAKKAASKSDSTQTQGVSVSSVNLYKPINLGQKFIKESNISGGPMYTSLEIRNCINDYIIKKNLVDEKDKKMVMLDDLLFAMVNRKIQNPIFPRIIPRANILEPLIANNFNEYFQLYKGDNTPLFKNPIKGQTPKIDIVTEMKIGRKVVTRVSNFENFRISPEELAADLRKLCSGSTTISETPKKVSEVQVQGPHGQLIIDHFNKSGIPSKFIQFENKVKRQKKKK
ncbi:hypothetical protein KAFR_0B05470 [Kazachstania africana CBS 2517]|uniref:SUI1 domain-containing protein n=1 Tax=Kazachstania africana (strain ATCC 22294 / BCRC 22015 / CBS 2517 / CECT 1963 / NBRC 1671 / NRRL Y-8276) TaxID=1071382 RepID=H2AR42_KAZAF|nr:hypothetical protein KAFR_0B05470 [Kazachstania africana CBS 2517]CCF56842.1 hypothetical protein KAFR_0B05470 [Kazachstania africana CBS 2517]